MPGLVFVSLQFRTESAQPGPSWEETPVQHQRSRKRVLTDGALREVAKSIHRKDWVRLANKLGFFQQDIEEIQHAYPSSTEQQVLLLNYIYGFAFYTPVEDGMYYGITRGGRPGGPAGGWRPVLCPEHISKTTLARVMKFHDRIDLIQGECSAQES